MDFLMMDMVGEIGSVVGLPTKDMTSMHVSVHEDNSDALILAETIPPQFTPRSKYYCTKTVWFREEIMKREVLLKKLILRSNLAASSPKVCLALSSSTSGSN